MAWHYGLMIIATENIFLTGSVDALQNWSPDNAIPLSSTNYPTWNGKCFHIFALTKTKALKIRVIYSSNRKPPANHTNPIQIYPQERRVAYLGI